MKKKGNPKGEQDPTKFKPKAAADQTKKAASPEATIVEKQETLSQAASEQKLVNESTHTIKSEVAAEESDHGPVAVSETHILVKSMCTLLATKVKCCFHCPAKNKELAQNGDLRNLMALIGEQLLPQWCKVNVENEQQIDSMHSLIYLLAQKVQAVFFNRVMHTIIDQNWDLKGLAQVLLRVLETLDLRPSLVHSTIDKQLEKLMNAQNLSSSGCMRTMSSYISKPNKLIREEDFKHTMRAFQTDFEFLKEDIQRFRAQRLSPACFSVLHPWNYSLDAVDFKYIVNNNLNQAILRHLEASELAQVFWLSFFKNCIATSADEFFEAIRQVCQMNSNEEYWTKTFGEFADIMAQNHYVMSLEKHAAQILKIVEDLSAECQTTKGYFVLNNQLKLYQGDFPGTGYADEASLVDQYTYEVNPKFQEFQEEQVAVMDASEPTFTTELEPEPQQVRGLKSIQLTEVDPGDLAKPMALQRKEMCLRTNKIPEKALILTFQNSDTEELKNVEYEFPGDRAILKVGEGETNHYQIPNDKKLMDSQFMIVIIDGQYYIRDLGYIHSSRMKLELNAEIQIQQGTVADIGKVIHYHFDQVTHSQEPDEEHSESFMVMQTFNESYAPLSEPSVKMTSEDGEVSKATNPIEEGTKDRVSEDGDAIDGNDFEIQMQTFPNLRARPAWVSPEESPDSIQNEINVFADGTREQESIGRSAKRSIQLQVKAISAEHCFISYSCEKGWTIYEKGKAKESSNGTFVFLKSNHHMQSRMPSDPILLQDGMVISFVNYELKVRLEERTSHEVNALYNRAERFFGPQRAGIGKPIISLAKLKAAAAKPKAGQKGQKRVEILIEVPSLEQDVSASIVERKWTPAIEQLEQEDPSPAAQSKNESKPGDSDDFVTLRLLHWNILAQKFCSDFEKIDDDSAILKIENRLRLMREHLQSVDSDIVGISEVDAMKGSHPEAYLALIQMMQELGYGHQYFEQSTAMSASAVFHKVDKFSVLESSQRFFTSRIREPSDPGEEDEAKPAQSEDEKNENDEMEEHIMPFDHISSSDEPEFFMHCLFRLESHPRFKFVFSETHLKGEASNVEQRVEQAALIKAYYADKYRDIPVFIAGDFNEEYQNEPIADVMDSSFQDLYSIMQLENDSQSPPEKQHPAFTTFKYTAEEGWVKRTIDYIFIAKNDWFEESGCTISQYLDPADLERDDLLNLKIGNPCPNHPSDHYSIGYELRLKLRDDQKVHRGETITGEGPKVTENPEKSGGVERTQEEKDQDLEDQKLREEFLKQIGAPEVAEIPPKTKQEKLEMLKNNERLDEQSTTKLTDYLRTYKAKFNGNQPENSANFDQLDELWTNSDKDQNGYLREEEAKAFMAEVSKLIGSDLSRYHDDRNVERLFKSLDEDRNGYLIKAEIALLLKLAFKRPKQATRRAENMDKAKKAAESYQLSVELKTWMQKYGKEKDKEKDKVIEKDNENEEKDEKEEIEEEAIIQPKGPDQIWDEVDLNKNGVLDKEEAKQFLDALAETLNPEKAACLHGASSHEELFDKFDDEKNGFIAKDEMAVFIKQSFKDVSNVGKTKAKRTDSQKQKKRAALLEKRKGQIKMLSAYQLAQKRKAEVEAAEPGDKVVDTLLMQEQEIEQRQQQEAIGEGEKLEQGAIRELVIKLVEDLGFVMIVAEDQGEKEVQEGGEGAGDAVEAVQEDGDGEDKGDKVENKVNGDEKSQVVGQEGPQQDEEDKAEAESKKPEEAPEDGVAGDDKAEAVEKTLENDPEAKAALAEDVMKILNVQSPTGAAVEQEEPKGEEVAVAEANAKADADAKSVAESKQSEQNDV